jgi:beta-lactamase class D
VWLLLFVTFTAFAQPPTKKPVSGACFLLLDTVSGEFTRSPNEICESPLPPASTFKIPHAIAALDSGVVKDKDELIRYNPSTSSGRAGGTEYEAWRRDHTLASAMRYSVVWYFQKIAERLGMEREEYYLRRLRYGNADPSSGLTTFWLGGSLRITPIEQMTFLRRLYYTELPVSDRSLQIVRDILVQPPNVIVNATGDHPFDAPWPSGTVVSAKTGSTSFEPKRAVRWIVGHIRRDRRAWLFVTAVTGADNLDANAAIDLGARELRAHKVL